MWVEVKTDHRLLRSWDHTRVAYCELAVHTLERLRTSNEAMQPISEATSSPFADPKCDGRRDRAIGVDHVLSPNRYKSGLGAARHPPPFPHTLPLILPPHATCDGSPIPSRVLKLISTDPDSTNNRLSE